MDWIKKRYDQFILAVLATVLLVFAILIVLKTGSFGEKFSEAASSVVPKMKIPPLILDRVDEAKNVLQTPPAWTVDTKEPRTRGSLFVSDVYMIGEEGIPKKPKEDAIRQDSLTGNKIPNKWFLDNALPLREATVASQDPDQDGFANEDEWRANPQTNPNDKESHPPYHTKLFLKQFIQVPFRLILSAYDGDPKEPEKMNFQINTVDLKQPSEFLKIGESVPNTKFKLEKFEFKEVMNESIGEKVDVSELTLVNTETGVQVVLVLTKVTNSPDVFGLFDYQWPQPPLDIRVRKLGEFALKPDIDKRYKLVDINETQAVIQLPSGESHTVVPDPRKAGK